jgi:hypothetical protein
LAKKRRKCNDVPFAVGFLLLMMYYGVIGGMGLYEIGTLDFCARVFPVDEENPENSAVSPGDFVMRFGVCAPHSQA